MPERAPGSTGKAAVLAIVVALSGLAGCIVPEAAPILGHERKKRIFYDVIRGMQCEIRRAVRGQIEGNAVHLGDEHGESGKRKLAWFETWSAVIGLKLHIKDNYSFNPGVSLKMPNYIQAQVWRADHTLRPVDQSYNFGIGGEFSYKPSRDDIVEFSYPFSDFLHAPEPDPDKPCYNIGGYTIEADLKLDDWLDDVLDPVKKCAFRGYPSEEPTPQEWLATEAPRLSERCKNEDLSKYPPPVTNFQHNVTFVISFDVNATPQWDLVRVSTSGGKLLDFSREDTSELLITLAPTNKGQQPPKISPRGRTTAGPPPVSIAPEALLTRNALQIGSAVRDAFGR